MHDAEQCVNTPLLKGHVTQDQVLMNVDIVELIKMASDKLPEDMRMAIILRVFDGMCYEVFAQTMSCPVGTVRSRIFRAREAIDNKLQPLLDKR